MGEKLYWPIVLHNIKYREYFPHTAYLKKEHFTYPQALFTIGVYSWLGQALVRVFTSYPKCYGPHIVAASR